MFAIFAFFWLPRSPSTWWYLNAREKDVARMRILTDSSVAVDEKLSIRDSFRPLESPMYWYDNLPLACDIRSHVALKVMGNC